MKLEEKKLTVGEAAEKLADLTQGFLDRFPPEERKRRVKAFRSVIVKASSQKAAVVGTASKLAGTARVPAYLAGHRAR